MDGYMDWDYNSSWSNDYPPPYYDDDGGSHFNHGGGGFYNGGHYNHHHGRYYNNHFQDYGPEPPDSFGYNNGPPFNGRKRQFYHGPSEYFDGGNCAKLYVSNVPKEVNVEDIHSLFGEHGNIIEVILFKHLPNLQHRDGCFVKFSNIEEADMAIWSLNGQYTFPGRMHPIEVKYAAKKPERPGPGWFKTHESKVAAGFSKTYENKLFAGPLNKLASKAEIADIFLPYGYVEDVYIILDEHRRSRGMGFITFTHRDMAAAAIDGLNGKYVMEGCDHPMTVRYAEPKKPKFGDNRFEPHFGDRAAQFSPHSRSLMSSQAGSEAPSVSSNGSIPRGETADPPECDWSEHICPDGNAYYYNCVTCESLWEKPKEYSFYEQQLENYNDDPQYNSHW
uniref:flowering time control protein FCA n=1 Tax=Erigeron canadensis TaxID=72917 RepID=UPI001CB8B7B7|nr:flowering time control protein FCA [Erigeron canadensis]